MSASLVGSEMCIRDRSTSVRDPPFRNRKTTADMLHAFEPGTARPQDPVSYTHLTLPTICSV
eukprot:6947399-Alexandrium_andersonii.AAC.1